MAKIANMRNILVAKLQISRSENNDIYSNIFTEILKVETH